MNASLEGAKTVKWGVEEKDEGRGVGGDERERMEER